MYTITKTFEFAASHSIDCLPHSHKCRNLHGHTYRVTVELKCDSLNEYGMVQDYGDLDPLRSWIMSNLDHKHLNNIIVGPPTAENIARFVFDTFDATYPYLSAVTVSESPNTTAEYRS